MGSWLKSHPEQHISINLEASDLASETLPTLLSTLLNRSQISPSQIALELTEREFADPKTSAPIVARYRNAGHSIYIDDFGTGYSSLSYLQNLDVDVLKIDKSFVDALEYKNVTPHIIEMAKTLKLKMVAEGIETAGKNSGYASMAYIMVRAGYTVNPTRYGIYSLGGTAAITSHSRKEQCGEAQMGGALPATSRHTRHLPWLLPSGPDR